MPSRWSAVLVATAALAAACATHDPRRPPPGQARRAPTCPERFAACAPQLHYEPSVDASRLELRRQLQITLRMDVPEKVTHEAGAAVLARARTADVPGLLELAALREDEWAILGKCQCPGEENEWDRRGIGAVLEQRLPPAELRSPRAWEDRMVAPLATIRDLTRRMALRGVAGDPADDLAAARRAADLELCHAVHGARTFLLPAAYADAVEAVRRRREAEAGASAAELAAGAIRRHEQAASCVPPAPAPAPAEDEDE